MVSLYAFCSGSNTQGKVKGPRREPEPCQLNKPFKVSSGFFHRFCCFKHNIISETLSLGKESSRLVKKSFHFHGNFHSEIPSQLGGEKSRF